MRRQTAAMAIVMVSFVSTRLKRKSPEPDTELDPLTPGLESKMSCTAREHWHLFTTPLM